MTTNSLAGRTADSSQEANRLAHVAERERQELLRRVELSNGGSVLVDIDDSNSDEAIRAAIEGQE